MSSNPSFNAPVLNYVGSVDVASATLGSTLYNILFDASFSTIGNVLMFEYKIQPANVSVPDPDTITLGYVNVENAVFTNGIANQWTIAVPAVNNVYNPPIEQDISVRVYSGLTGQTEIAVSAWSNTLAVHVPPQQPVINRAYFDQNYFSVDDLWVYMTPNDSYNYSEVKFIVAYYFQNSDNNTTWVVSDPLLATDITYNGEHFRQLSIPDIGHVDTYTNVVYVAVYAVYPFTNGGNNYYSVSEISETVTALPASDYPSPTLTTIDYEVYTSPPLVPGNQTMVVNWIPPENSVIPIFIVDRYILQQSVDGGIWTTVDDNIPSTDLSYPVDVSSYGCGTNIAFRLIAVTAGDTESPPSNVESLNIFVYSTAPEDLVINSSSVSEDGVNITVSFENPTDIGCGAGYQFVIEFADASGVVQETKYVPYDIYVLTYTLPYTDLNISTYGTVTVYLQTEDTNQLGSPYPTVYRDGISTQVPYIASTLTLNPVNYQVYVDRSQNIILSWNNPATGEWSVESYDIYLDDSYIASVSGSTQTYTYLATQPCETTLTFTIKANLENGSVNFVITSNNESINIFYYATAPTAVVVDWASANADQTIIDVLTTFTVANPYDNGCGEIQNWVVQVKDISNNVLKSENVAYVENQTTYLVYIDDVQYVNQGTVEVFMKTTDTNSDDIMNGASASGGFVSSGLPIFDNVVINEGRTILTFDVLSQTALSRVGRFIWSTYNSMTGITRANKAYITNNQPPAVGESVTITTLENDVLQYRFTFQNSFFGTSTIPLNLVIAASNTVGISLENINNT